MGVLISLLSGGLLRMLPEILSFFDRKNERKHELDMLDKQTALKKAESEAELAIAKETHESQVDSGMMNAWIESIKGQSVQTGIKWVDALSSLVRPTITFAIFGLYVLVRIVTILHALQTSPEAWQAIITQSWTDSDKELLSGIIGFWFVNRKFDKVK